MRQKRELCIELFYLYRCGHCECPSSNSTVIHIAVYHKKGTTNQFVHTGRDSSAYQYIIIT